METDPFVRAIHEDLEAAVATGDETVARAAQAIARTLESALRLHLQDAVSRAALELTDQLPAGRIDVRLSGRDLQLVYMAEGAPAAPVEADEAGTARLTLRMPESLKQRVEAAADAQGVSTNAWLVRAVTQGLEHRRAVTGRRITGFATS